MKLKTNFRQTRATSAGGGGAKGAEGEGMEGGRGAGGAGYKFTEFACYSPALKKWGYTGFGLSVIL